MRLVAPFLFLTFIALAGCASMYASWGDSAATKGQWDEAVENYQEEAPLDGHGRQISNRDLNLAPGETRTLEERARLYLGFLWNARSTRGRSVRELLELVLWGDKSPGGIGSAFERIWLGANDENWRLPHLGVHIFGEMLGYARLGELPPRNNRVSKTLYALGFDVSYV